MSISNRAAFLKRSAVAGALAALPARVLAQTPALVTVNMAGTVSDDMTPIMYGIQAGIFRKHGLDLQVNPMTNGAAGIAGLLSGQFDLAKGSITTILAGHEKGVPFSIIAEDFLNSPKEPTSAFMVLKDSPIQTGKDFNDQLVASASIGDIGTMALQAWVDQHGGDSKRIKFIEIPFSAVGAAIEAGRVVAGVASNPQMTQALEAGKLRALPGIFEAIAPLYTEVVWATTKDFSAKHPDVIRNFARGWAEAVNYTNTHHAETVDLTAGFTHIDPAVIGRMSRVLASPTLVPAHIQPIIDASARYGLLKASFPAADVIDVNAR